MDSTGPVNTSELVVIERRSANTWAWRWSQRAKGIKSKARESEKACTILGLSSHLKRVLKNRFVVWAEV